MNPLNPQVPNDNWATPDWLFAKLDDQYQFTLDPCADHLNHKCAKYFTKQDDGLTQSWDGERVFMNPPYGRSELPMWMKKASESDALVVALVPVSTSARWWRQYVFGESDVIEYLPKRVKFGGSKGSPRFDSAIVYFKTSIHEHGLWPGHTWN